MDFICDLLLNRTTATWNQFLTFMNANFFSRGYNLCAGCLYLTPIQTVLIPRNQ